MTPFAYLRSASRLRAYAIVAVLLTPYLAPAVHKAPPEHTVHANWDLANRFTAESLRPFVYSSAITPGWINKTNVFWYTWRDSNGVHFWKVDCKAKKKTPLFDTARMAALLSELAKRPYDANNLPFTTVTFDEKNADLMRFTVDNIQYEYDLKKDTLKSLGRPKADPNAPPAGPGQGRGRGGGGGGFQGRGGPNADFHNYSPDKKAYVYALDRNLYYVEVKAGKDQPPIQLTKDGEKYYSFGSREDQTERQEMMRQQIQTQRVTTQQTRRQQQQQQQDDTGGTGGFICGGRAQSTEKRVRASVTWSKDSKRFWATRSDERKVKDLYLVNNLAEPRPTLITYRYAMPGRGERAPGRAIRVRPSQEGVGEAAGQ